MKNESKIKKLKKKLKETRAELKEVKAELKEYTSIKIIGFNIGPEV